MIRRLYADNYRCLVDFTWEPGAETLILGYNGSGKTSALDAMDLIRAWSCGWERLEELLDQETLTRWQNSEVAKFELDLETGNSLFRYRVEFVVQAKGTSVRTESLRIGDRTVFARNKEAVTSHNAETEPILQVIVPPNQSAVNALSATEGSELVAEFLAALTRMIIVRPMPPLMDNEARRPEPRPWYRFENFVAWYWSQTSSGKFTESMLGLLSDVWDDFDYLKLDQIGRGMALSAVFKRPKEAARESVIEFHELSEGERMLVVLYTLLAYQSATPPTTIVIDEPDNFVALMEIQPWLLKMLDHRPADGQFLIVSHNQEIIQSMAESSVAYFSRPDHLSPAVVSSVTPDETGLSLSERLARGWIDA